MILYPFFIAVGCGPHSSLDCIYTLNWLTLSCTIGISSVLTMAIDQIAKFIND